MSLLEQSMVCLGWMNFVCDIQVSITLEEINNYCIVWSKDASFVRGLVLMMPDSDKKRG